MTKEQTTKSEFVVGKATPVDKKPAEVVEVPVDKLQTIVDRVEALEKSVKEKDSEISALKQSVSSQRFAEAVEEQTNDDRPRVHFKLLDGKPVVGWPEKTGEEKINELIFNPQTGLPAGEVLKCVYYFADGTKTPLIDQLRFTKAMDLAYARVVEDKGEVVVVEFEDQTLFTGPLEVNKMFLNA